MGYSLIATTCIFMLTVAIGFQITYEQLAPTLLSTQKTFSNLHNRDINKLNTDIQITNVSTNWWDSLWGYRKLITINSSQITEDFTNFTILVDTTDINLRDNAKTNGNDIAFVDYNGSIKFNHEIEEYDGSTGQLSAWVKIPTLSKDQHTLIYMYYGNSQASNQQNPTNTWDDNYTAIWHFNNNSLADSTSNGYDGTNSGTSYATTCKIAGGREYNGDDRIDVNNFIALQTQLTVEAWVFRDSSDTASFIRLLTEGPNWDTSDWCLYWRIADEQMRFIINNGDYQEGGTFDKQNQWFHAAITYDSGDAILFNDGTLEADWTGLFGTSINDNYQTLTIGNQNNGGRAWIGKLDEIRISNISRSEEWLETSYNTMNTPNTFCLIGNQQSLASNEIDLSILVTNHGKTTLKTADISLLINGKISQQTCPLTKIKTDTNTTITATGIITGTDRIKIISAEGISDYYIYEI